MSEREAYSWSLLRVVPRIERGEQINIGAVVFSRRHDFLGLELVLDEPRLLAFAPDLDLDELRTQLTGLERVAAGDPGAGRVAGMSTGDRFGFLAAPSNTILQASPVHVGLCVDPAEALERLVDRYVRL
ncbi:MAG: DUF3037 domain-containing protein [Solirubrobacteraceae bacterium]|nr:DUF3037 domain-containing protein [Solirubrobacteraceae bacterium]